jgi:poly-gamma-glutamate capsule biosynthesis protein CapA/YwtB (metallophosphatase superfamily)
MFCFRISYIMLVLVLVSGTSCSDPAQGNKTLHIVFAGDILLDRGVREKIIHLGVDSLFHPTVDQLFAGSDMVVANLECPATRIKEPLSKKYVFRAEPEWLMALRKHGITHLDMANNHVMDQGRQGLEDTYKNIVLSGMIPLGYGENIRQACKPQLISTDPRKVYILSSVQVPSENWTYLEEKACVCEESFDVLSEKIKRLRKAESGSLIIVQLHWGAEHKLKPMTMQKQQAHQLIDAGADCIIGHHTHTIQTMELYMGKPVFYGIGNFIFDQADLPNTEGLLVKLDVTESSFRFDTIRFVIEKCKPIIKERIR